RHRGPRTRQAIERFGERLSLASAGSQHDELLHALDAAQEPGGGALQCRARQLRARRFESRALIGAIARSLDESEVRDVARDRRLRGLEATLMEPPAKLLLTAKRFLIDELEDDGLAACLHQVSGRTTRIHDSPDVIIIIH